MRIAVLAPGYGWTRRGVEVFVGDLVGRLCHLHPDWQFDIHTIGQGGAEGRNVRLVHVPAFSRYSRTAKLYAQIGHRLRIYLRTPISAECLFFSLSLAPRLWFRRYDLIFNQAGWFAGLLLGAKRRRDGTPFVHKTAGGYSHGELMLARQRPDVVICTSPTVRDWLAQEVPGLVCVLTPEAVDTNVFRPSDKEVDDTVLFVGAMESMKRPELTIRAAATLDGVRLVMIGEGSLRAEVEDMGSRLLGPERFTLIPDVANAELPTHYNRCSVFTLASDEPFGIVFLESMACNRPVVGHNTPVTRWLMGDAGLTCNCDDIGEYAATLRRALTTDFGDSPRRRALEFDWDVVVRRYDEVFSRFAGGRR